MWAAACDCKRDTQPELRYCTVLETAGAVVTCTAGLHTCKLL